MVLPHRGRRELIRRISEPFVLLRAWQSVRAGKSPQSAGPDDVTLEQFGQQAAAHLRRLRNNLREGNYTFGGYRGVPLVKDRSKPVDNPKNRRPISIASIRDRIVQRAILDVIWVHIRDMVCTKASYGGVGRYSHSRLSGGSRAPHHDPKRNVRAAAAEIVKLRESGHVWVFETDIERFYPSINRDRLLGILNALLPDNTLNFLIEGFLSTAITNVDELPDYLADLWDPFMGVPQGGVLSPVLANLYLHEFDDIVTQNSFQMIRYVDDLVILTKSDTDSKRAYELCLQHLSSLGLKMHKLESKTKTNILSPGTPFQFLGLDFNQHSIRPVQKKWNKLRESLRLATSAKFVDTLPKVIYGVNGLVRGWVKAYAFCNIFKSELRSLDEQVTHSVEGWMRSNGLLLDRQELRKRGRDALGLERAEKIPIMPLLPPKPLSQLATS